MAGEARVVFRKGQRRLAAVPDLPATPPRAGVFVPVEHDVIQNFLFINTYGFVLDSETALDQIKVHGEDLLARGIVQVRIVERDVDSGFERLVDDANPVHCEKKNTGVEFQ